MAQYVLRRLVTLAITLMGIMVVTFFISMVVPLDPLASIAGPQAPQETVERLRVLYGFDQPVYVQFGRYIKRLVHGDLGTSFQTGRPVLEDILRFFPATIELASLALRSSPSWSGFPWACFQRCTAILPSIIFPVS